MFSIVYTMYHRLQNQIFTIHLLNLPFYSVNSIHVYIATAKCFHYIPPRSTSAPASDWWFHKHEEKLSIRWNPLPFQSICLYLKVSSLSAGEQQPCVPIHTIHGKICNVAMSIQTPSVLWNSCCSAIFTDGCVCKTRLPIHTQWYTCGMIKNCL